MSDEKSPGAATVGASLQIQGGAAIVAPIGAFPGGVPPNALIVLPVKKPTDELVAKLNDGPFAVTPDQMWELLGFNGPAVQVTDNEGRPLSIGLNDLLSGLEKHWQENPTDLGRARIYAQELMKYGRAADAVPVLSKLVAGGGGGEDWLALGVAQLAAGQSEKAEGTLNGALNLLPQSPFPALHLARAKKERGDADGARTMVEKAISTDPECIDAWVSLYRLAKDAAGEEDAIAAVEALGAAEPNKKSAAPYIALQSLFSGSEDSRERALAFAQKAVERDSNNSLALVSLSALYGQKGELPKVIELLRPHESKMVRDVRLANNYFEALMQTRDIERVTKLLNALSASPQRDVKQFAVERSRMVAQLLQRQQAQLRAPASAR